jgi:ADP-ribosylglycohydrolase
MTAERDLDRARGALLGTFTGDALGMPFESASPGALPERLEMLEARLGRGTYTDDTQMTIALAKSLLECGGLDEEHLGRTFLAAYDPRRGYGSGTRAVLALLSEGVPVADAAVRAFAWATALPDTPFASISGWTEAIGGFCIGAASLILPLLADAFGKALNFEH